MNVLKDNFFGCEESTQINFCKKCVISNQKPVTLIESKHKSSSVKEKINFTDGVCDACVWNEEKQVIDWFSREKKLKALCDSHRRTDGGYDVIVPASGGKDSRYVAHLLKTKYNMNPLTVTWKPHLPTEIGLKNFFSMIDNGFDNHLISTNGDVQRKLTRLAFKNLGHPFQPFILGQRTVGPKAALQTGAKLVFYGENVAEYGNKISENYIPTMKEELYTSFDFFTPGRSLSDFNIAGINLNNLIKSEGIALHDLQIYSSPSLSEIKKNSVEVHYMSYYKKWIPQENYYYAVENTGFEPNPSRRDGTYNKYAGIDDMMEDLHYFMQLIKFGMGRGTWDASQEIRTNKITREEGVALVRRYDAEIPSTFMTEILNYLEMSESEFNAVVDKYRPDHLWKRSLKDGWNLRRQVM